MKALAQPGQLAHHTSTEYAPLTMKGLDGSSFGNDLLHLIGFEADSKEAYLKMYTYYNKVGNRGAACLCASPFTFTETHQLSGSLFIPKSTSENLKRLLRSYFRRKILDLCCCVFANQDLVIDLANVLMPGS